MLLFHFRIGAIFFVFSFFFCPRRVNESLVTKYPHRKETCLTSTCIDILAETETKVTKVAVDYYCYYYHYYCCYNHHYHRPTGCCAKIKLYL
jgi:hypothetical protein